MTLVIPALDIMGGKVVRLVRGDPSQATVYSDDPLAVAEGFAAAGATRLHIVDLDAALGQRPLGLNVLRRITAATPLEVQYGGGLRTLDLLGDARAAGARWVITGTAALADDGFLCAAAAAHPDSLILAIDLREGQLLTDGWQKGAPIDVEQALSRAAAHGVQHLMITDAAADGTMGGTRVEVFGPVLSRGFEVILAGGISTIDDIRRLAAAVPVGLTGIVIGTALLRGALTMADAQSALAAVRP